MENTQQDLNKAVEGAVEELLDKIDDLRGAFTDEEIGKALDAVALLDAWQDWTDGDSNPDYVPGLPKMAKA